MAQGKVEICGVNTAKLPLLKTSEQEAFFTRIKQGDEEARQQYIEGNLRLVLSVIRRFANSSENLDDLFQIGCIGLIKAIDNFNLDYMVKFSTYAVPMIIGEVRRHLRDNNAIRVSRSLRDIAYKALQTKEKLTAKNIKGGEMPVIIGSGFGAVIFHEACGHGLEATSVAPKLSIFTELENKRVGTNKVTLIDDGTLAGEWGSNIIDDEGEITQKNILIENGILTSFLIDKYSNIKMNKTSNGCGRRESYEYAPTSRMSNTYLAPGTDTLEDMIKTIKHGVYCKKLSGGQVNTTTGDFNFGVDAAYVIKDGKIGSRIKGVTLIGNGKDILNQVEMVGNDLSLGDGYCGSKSGMVPVTCGQPTIKVSKILVGGKE